MSKSCSCRVCKAHELLRLDYQSRSSCHMERRWNIRMGNGRKITEKKNVKKEWARKEKNGHVYNLKSSEMHNATLLHILTNSHSMWRNNRNIEWDRDRTGKNWLKERHESESTVLRWFNIFFVFNAAVFLVIFFCFCFFFSQITFSVCRPKRCTAAVILLCYCWCCSCLLKSSHIRCIRLKARVCQLEPNVLLNEMFTLFCDQSSNSASRQTSLFLSAHSSSIGIPITCLQNANTPRWNNNKAQPHASCISMCLFVIFFDYTNEEVLWRMYGKRVRDAKRILGEISDDERV